MEIEVLAFGIAREIIGKRVVRMNTLSTTVGDLRTELTEAFPDLQQLASLSFAVNENYEDDSYELFSGAQVAIIPPVSGG